MDMKNQTVTYFIIKGISELNELQVPVFLLVFLLYLYTLVGNMTILVLVCQERQLHTPMYFFLSNLSILDMSSTTVTLHKTLTTFITGNKTVSFAGCMAHTYFCMALECTELLILAVMSYDRYMAVCNPLHYHMIMSYRVCVLLAPICWVSGFVEVIPLSYILTNLTCFMTNVINHFFCDVLPLMEISCSDLALLQLWIHTENVFISGLMPFSLTVISYIFITLEILKIRTGSGRRKAFYTCSSHLTIVVLLYVTLFCLYLLPTSRSSLDSSKIFSLFNTAAVPLLNPIIYSLKNNEVKKATMKLFNFFHAKLRHGVYSNV
ncbi:olfactory receptor 2AP1-like [Dendropsophus ebraccatus]|uniref:olfactory receptor 2AP1-like n=1 Tax=Dendropsophus ebraccatus TaxID=150705 RepID=UPI0038315A75